MKKVLRKIVLIMAVAMMLAGMSTIAASAKNVKLKSSRFKTSAAEAESVATPVSMGAMTVKLPNKASGFLKFTAPATKAYSFTVSKLKTNRFSCGYFYIMTTYGKQNQYIEMKKVATQGGEASGLYVATKGDKRGSLVSRFLKSRTGTTVLEQGQTVYIYLNFTRKGTLRLKIS